jgi:hypothetical protein
MSTWGDPDQLFQAGAEPSLLLAKSGVWHLEGLLRYHVAGKTITCRKFPALHRFQDFGIWEPDELLPPCPTCGGVLERNRYLVDLGEWEGNGACSCEHFCFRLQPQARARLEGLVEGRPTPLRIKQEILENPFRCSHIMICRRYVLDELIEKIGQQQQKQKHENNQRQAAMGMAYPTR